jgi:hypothetical protein
MGLFGFGKKSHVQEREKDPLDCTDRDTEWYLSEEGKACWEEAESHVKEMIDYVNEKGLNGKTLYDYLDDEYMSLPLFPMKFVYEYLKSDIEVACYLDDYEFAYPILALFLSGEADDNLSDANRKIQFNYPNFLDWDKNPLLKYFYAKKFKMFYSEDETLDFVPLNLNHLITVIRYIDSVATEKDEDANEESWVSDPKIFVKKNIYTHIVESLPNKVVEENMKKAAKYPELLIF